MKIGIRCVALALAIGSMVAGFCAPAWSETSVLDAIRKRGQVVCGVSDHAPGFSEVSGSGTWSGLDVEFCSALAAAVLGNKDSVKFLDARRCPGVVLRFNVAIGKRRDRAETESRCSDAYRRRGAKTLFDKGVPFAAVRTLS